MIDTGDPFEDLGEAGPSEFRCRGKVSTAPEGFTIAIQEHGQGPAPLFAEHLQGGLVYDVDVGSFFPVDLYIDEQVVHQVGNFIVFETFMGHDMAPMAGGVSD